MATRRRPPLVTAPAARPNALLEPLESRQLLSASLSTTRVSIASDGTQTTAHSDKASVSADGRYVAFTSTADNLVPGDTTGHLSVYLRDRQTNTTTRVSVANDGTSQPDDTCFDPVISADGRYVAYSSKADNLVAGDTNGYSDIFVYDTVTQTTIRASQGTGGAPTDGNSYSPSISGDGRYVAFLSDADNLVAGDTNAKADVFVFDAQAQATQRVSLAPNGAEGNASSYNPAISSDGNVVAFLSDASNLVSNDTNNVADVFVFDRTTGTTTRVSKSSTNLQANGASGKLALSADGRYVAYESAATNLVTGDTNGKTDVFLTDRTAGTTVRASVGPGGAQANAASSAPALSGDGRYLVFTSAATNLVTGDTNAKVDVFVYDRATAAGGAAGGTAVTRTSTGPLNLQSNDDSDLAAISGDGRFVAFFSNATNIVADDTNGVGDVFVKDRFAVPQVTASGSPDGVTSLLGIASGDATPSLDDGTDFGAADINTGSVTRIFTLTNTGGDPLSFTGPAVIKIDGAGASSFSVAAQPAVLHLDPGDSTTFQITFDPAALAVRTARVSFTSTDAATPNYSFQISGVGIDSTIPERSAVAAGPVPIVNSSPTPITFTSPVYHGAAAAQVFTVTNAGGSTITLGQVTLTNNALFEVAAQPATASLSPGQSTTFTLRLLTSIPGPATATVSLTNTLANSADPRTVTFAVAGTVAAPHLAAAISSQPLASGATLDFGSAVKSKSPVTRTITLTNTGSAPLVFGVLSLPAGFTSTVAAVPTLAVGASVDIPVSLATAAVGNKSGVLSLPSGDPALPTFTLDLTGTITAPALAVSLDGADQSAHPRTAFDPATAGTAGPTKIFTLTNTGTAPLTLTALTIPAGFTVIAAPASPLAPGATTTLTVQVSTAITGTFSGNLIINSDDPTTPTYGLPLTATVSPPPTPTNPTPTLPQLSFDATPVTLDTTRQGQPAPSHTFTITNTGNAALTLTSPAATDPFTLSAAPALTVQPGQSATFTVTIPTTVAHAFTGSLTFTTNDASAPTVTVPLSATVTPAPRTAVGIDSVFLTRKPSAITIGGSKTAKAAVTATIVNSGASPVAGTYKITFRASTALSPGASDPLLGTATAKLKLAKGAKAAVKANLTFPKPPADGTYSVYAILTGPAGTDPYYSTVASPTTVRLETAHVALAAGSPALGLTTAGAGKKLTLAIPVANHGNVAAAGKAAADVFVSPDGTLNGAVQIASVPSVKLAINPNTTARLALKLTLAKTLPAAIAKGNTYTLIVRLRNVLVTGATVGLPADGIVSVSPIRFA